MARRMTREELKKMLAERQREAAPAAIPEAPPLAGAAPPLPEKEKGGIFSRLKRFSVGAFGETLGTAAASLAGVTGRIDEAAIGEAEYRRQLARLLQRPDITEKQRTRIRSQLAGGRQVLTAAETLPSIQKTGKQIAGEAIGTLGTALAVGGLPGALPVGLGARVAGIAGEAAIAGGTLGVAGALREERDAASVVKSGLLSAVTGAAVGAAIPLAGRAASLVAKTLASKLSGVPTAAIETAFRNPKIVRQTIRQAAKEGGDEVSERIYNSALGSLDDLKVARRDAYRAALDNIPERSLAGKLTVKGVKDKVTKTLGDFNVESKAGEFAEDAFRRSPLPKSYQSDLKEVVGRIYDWEDMTPKGLDDLREIIASYEKTITFGSSKADKQFNAIVSGVRRNLSDYVGDRVPEIKVMNTEYARASEVIGNIINSLKLESRTPQTAARKLANVFRPSGEAYRMAVRDLGEKTGKDLMADIAGMNFSRWVPEGLGGYLTTGVLAAKAFPLAPLASPRLVGEAVTTLGQIAPTISRQVPGTARFIGAQAGRAASTLFPKPLNK